MGSQEGLSSKRILLCGNYGFDNLGDETILEAMVRELRLRNAEPVVLSESPKTTEERFGCQAVLWRDWPQVFRALAESDAVVIGGGGLFQEYWGTDPTTLFGPHHNLTYYCGVAQAARLFHLPYALYSVGVGPIVSPAGRDLVYDSFQHAAYASVRDTGSLLQLGALGLPTDPVHKSADAATLLLKTSTLNRIKPEKHNALVVNLRPWSFWPNCERAQERLARDLARIAGEHNLAVFLVAFSAGTNPEHSDEAFLRQFQGLLQEQGVAEVTLNLPKKPQEALELFRGARFAVVMRYHAALFAAFSQTPFLALAYDPKVEHLLAELDYSGSCLPLAKVGESVMLKMLRQAARGELRPPSIESCKGLQQKARSEFHRMVEELGARTSTPAKLLPLATAALERLAAQVGTLPELQQRLRLVEAEREALARNAALLHEDVQRLASERDSLQQQHAQLVEAYGQRQQEVERLTAELAKASVERDSLQQQHTQLVEAYGQRQQEVERLHLSLTQITSTKWFKIASLYWRFRERLRRRPKLTTPPSPGSLAKVTSPAFAASTRETPRDSGPPTAPENSPSTESAPEDQSWLGDLANNPHCDVLVLPIIEWDFRFQRPQQLAWQFARHGHRVFYLSQKFHALGEPFTVSEKAQRVWEVSLKGPKRNVYQDTMDYEFTQTYFEAVDALRREHSLGATAVVVQLPFWWPLARLLRQRYGWPVIYDCMDYHAGFSTNREEMLQQEDELLAGSDLVVVPSKFLREHAEKHNSRVLVVPNACDFEHFAKVPYRPPANPPTIGYYGAIADWFDSDLVADLAELRPEWRFVLVGSTFTADTKRLARLPNVELVGEKPYAEIPQWVAQMDCLIIPFKRTPLTDATNPVKFFEIMAAGKPLVSVPLPELLPFDEYLRFAETAQAFAQQIELALAEHQPALAAKRREFAQNHTWRRRFESLYPEVVRAFPKASIVVVTYNNLHLTKQCLESIFARTEWPNYELFVVDNASTDGTPEYLTDLAQKNPRMRVILNPENRGFAAANNQALREAQGEFIVLLNNDTVVTRGWLSGLIRHLCLHPDFGLVGPVTNWIGNEAQIKVGYSRLEDMPRWAAEYTRAHGGVCFDIPVAALFCAAMRRDTFLKVGELDERFGPGMFEDDDYAIRVREAALRVVCVEDVFVHHHGKAAFGKLQSSVYEEIFAKNRRLFEEKWGRPWVPHQYRLQR